MFTVVKALEMYPKPQLIRDPSSREDKELTIPFDEIPGEAVQYLGETAELDGIIALSNYRLHITRAPTQPQQPQQVGSPSCINIPLTCIESVEQRELFYVHVYCKDARFYVIQFSDNTISKEWVMRISSAISLPTTAEEVFAFAHHAWARESKNEEYALASVNGSSSDEGYGDDPPSGHGSNWFKTEVARLRFDLQLAWRISAANKDFKLCATYPPEILVPKIISEQTLEKVAQFRSARRIPTVVWRHTGNGAVLARCSQPAVGWLGWRSAEDEDLVNAIAEACVYDNGCRLNTSSHSDETDGREFDSDSGSTSNATNDTSSLKDLCPEVAATRGSGEPKKVLIVDARSYAAAVGNRARGGGVEYPEYYPTSEIQFMGLANIHVVRKSFQALRTICNTSPGDQTTWLQSLDNTKWLHHLSGLLRTANLCAKALHVEGRPVMVHCSDGWDRTPQIVALTELLVDPYYRSLEGFKVLVEKEWLDFGHKMADRCGLGFCTSDANERCPVFLQFLDCVHQLLLQFPCDFEFNTSYLFKLAQHTYSSLFGTFLCNSLQERRQLRVAEETRSVWEFLASNPFNYCNLLYHPRNEVLWPKCEVRDLLLWQDVYVSEQGRGGAIVTGAAGATPVTNKGPRDNRLGCVSSSEDSGANNSRDGSENGDLGSQDIALVREELERLKVNYEESSPSGQSESSRPSSANQNSCDDESCGCADQPESENNPISSLRERASKGPRPIETSTDTLVPDGDLEERFRGRSPTLVATPNVTSQGKVQPANAALSKDSASHCDDQLSEKQPMFKPGFMMTATAAERRFRLNSRRQNVATPVRPLLELAAGCSRLARPWEVPSAAQERADTYFKNRFDSDGLPVHQTEAQRRLVAIYFTHQDQVEALQGDLHLTRMALCKQKSLANRCVNGKLRGVDPEDEFLIEGSETGPSLARGDASGSSTTASEVSSTWEAVDERETKPTLWVPDHAATSCMSCHTTFWLVSRKHHCRNCGQIVCAECSTNSLPLPSEQLYHPVRICDLCFRNLRGPEDEVEEKSGVDVATNVVEDKEIESQNVESTSPSE